MVIREWLKAGVISYIYLAERVNGSVKSKVLGQGVGSGSKVREAEWRASRSARSCENG